jgi:hypothetical protein
MGGDKASAERWMKKAEAVAAQTSGQASEQQKYHHKLEWLMSQG